MGVSSSMIGPVHAFPGVEVIEGQAERPGAVSERVSIGF